jgi:hypothetical protein
MSRLYNTVYMTLWLCVCSGIGGYVQYTTSRMTNLVGNSLTSLTQQGISGGEGAGGAQCDTCDTLDTVCDPGAAGPAVSIDSVSPKGWGKHVGGGGGTRKLCTVLARQ